MEPQGVAWVYGLDCASGEKKRETRQMLSAILCMHLQDKTFSGKKRRKRTRKAC